jgi:serine protease Do
LSEGYYQPPNWRQRTKVAAFQFPAVLVGFLIGLLVAFLTVRSVVIPSSSRIVDEILLGGQLADQGQSARLITQGSVVNISKRLRPSVVSICTRQFVSAGPGKSRQLTGVGSGIVIRPNGYIVTNQHVIDGSKDIRVIINSKGYIAKLVGEDYQNDIAVIKIEASHLKTPKFATKSQLKVGELAVAIGNPFGFHRSVTAGVISALNRSVEVSGSYNRKRVYHHLIQTDAAINPGNSGGALSNQQGEVVGINTLIFREGSSSQGIGFAIPINQALRIANRLIGS